MLAPTLFVGERRGAGCYAFVVLREEFVEHDNHFDSVGYLGDA
jgi:hypothetical protein